MKFHNRDLTSLLSVHRIRYARVNRFVIIQLSPSIHFCYISIMLWTQKGTILLCRICEYNNMNNSVCNHVMHHIQFDGIGTLACCSRLTLSFDLYMALGFKRKIKEIGYLLTQNHTLFYLVLARILKIGEFFLHF